MSKSVCILTQLFAAGLYANKKTGSSKGLWLGFISGRFKKTSLATDQRGHLQGEPKAQGVVTFRQTPASVHWCCCLVVGYLIRIAEVAGLKPTLVAVLGSI